MADEPILLVLVRGVLHVIGWICSIFAFPTVACLAGLSPIVINDAFKADSGQPLAHAVLAPFRFILGLVTLVLLSTLWVPATAYFVLRGGSDVVGLVIASSVAALFLQVYGMCYLHKYSSFAKNARIQEFLLNVLESLADVLALAGGVVGVASVLQLPAIISLVVLACQGRYQRSDLPLASIREVLIMQPVYALVSWLLFPLWLVSAVGVWRWPVLSEASKKENDSGHRKVHSMHVRAFLAYQGLRALVDIMSLLFCSLVCLLAPWRLARAWHAIGHHLLLAMTAPGSTWSAELDNGLERLWNETFRAVLDVLVYLPALLVFGTLYRAPYALGKCWELLRDGRDDDDQAMNIRFVILFQALLIMTDLVGLVCTVIVAVFVYRLPALWAMWKENKPQWDKPDFQLCSVIQFASLLLDLPFILLGLVASVILWRVPFMYRGLYLADNASARRSVVTRHCCWFLVDVLDAVFLVLFAVIVGTCMRAGRLLRDIKADYTWGDSIDDVELRCKLRLTVCLHSLLWLLDLPALILGLVICVTVWRAPRLVSLLRHGPRGKKLDLDADFTADLDADLGERQQGAQRRGYDIKGLFATHRLVGREFCFWLMDLCILPLMLVVFVSWRCPRLVRELVLVWKDPDESFAERMHIIVLRHALALGIDLPFVLAAVLCMWRLPLLLRHMHKSCVTDWDYRLAAARYLGYAALDIPTAFCIVLLHALGLLVAWRVAEFWRLVAQYKWGDSEHALAFRVCGRAAVDLPFVVVGVVAAVIAPWRAWDLAARVHKDGSRHCHAAYEQVVTHLFMAVTDWITGCMALCVAVTVVRLPGLIAGARRMKAQQPGADRCAVFYRAAIFSVTLLFFDLVTLLQACAVIAGVVRIPALLFRLVRVCGAFRSVRARQTHRRRRGSGAADALVAAEAGVVVGDDHTQHWRGNPIHAARRVDASSDDEDQRGQPLRHADVEDRDAGPLAALFWPRESTQTDLDLAAGTMKTREGDYQLYEKPEARLSRDDLLPAPPSISLWAAIVVDEWTLTMVAWSQLLRLPLKLVACCTMAVVAVISKRFDPAYRFSLAQPPLQEHQGLGDPIVVGFLSMMLSGVWADLSPLAIDTSFVYQLYCVAAWVLHDVAYFPLLANLGFLVMITGGAPLGWGRSLVESSITHYSRFERAMTLVYIVQIFMLPVFAAIQLVLFFLPLIIHHHDISLADYASAGGDRDFWSSWWTAPYGIWVLQGFWVLCMVIQYSALVRTLAAKFQFQTPAEQGVAHSKRKWIRFFAPLGCFVWVLSHVFQGRVWRLYKSLLGAPTAYFKRMPKACCLCQNLGLIIVYCVWCGWPLGVAAVISKVYVWIIAGVLSLLLVWRGYIVVEENWKTRHEPAAQARCTRMVFDFPDPVVKPNGALSHRCARISFTVQNNPRFGPGKTYTPDATGVTKGTKRWPTDRMFQVELALEGADIWDDLRAVYNRFAISMVLSLGFHPFKVCPQYMNPECVKADQWEGEILVDLRNARKKANFKSILDKLQAHRDSQFDITLYFGFSKRGKYQRQGKLFSVTTSAAEIWASHTQGTPVRATAGLQGAGRASAGGNSHATKAEAKLSASP